MVLVCISRITTGDDGEEQLTAHQDIKDFGTFFFISTLIPAQEIRNTYGAASSITLEENKDAKTIVKRGIRR